ncbi:MAG: 4-hydroxythreonine-4-phosphate dehydrogenase PdxA [Xanthomonadales bacterium]|nr:4-hydroxythreonine-4-phosphate dehydrogenase PdxA [Xanthomonadales bacterium]
MSATPRLAVTIGEPAGIGPELMIRLAEQSLPAELVAIGDPQLLQREAARLGVPLSLTLFNAGVADQAPVPGRIACLPVPLPAPVLAGQLDPANAPAVLQTLALAADGCRDGLFDAVLTLPVHKGVINQAGIAFTGHTEFFADRAGAQVLMLLAGADPALAPEAGIRVALASTHLPLRAVADAINADTLTASLRLLDAGLRGDFGLARPRIAVLGLNPHAGESGHLGREEIEVIAPALARLRQEGLDLTGPLSADTAFVPDQRRRFDAYFAMYHDQGLPVLKTLAFGAAVNITLGLPFVRTSVDHGVALDLAGQGRADAGSVRAAAALALAIARRRQA